MFTFTILIILAVFFLDLLLSTLNYRHRNHPVPDNVSDVYDQSDYDKWLKYTMENHRISMIEKVFDTVLLILFLSFGLFPVLAGLADGLAKNLVFQTLFFLGFYGAISFVLGIGFHWYRTFSIEERYGFNQSTIKTFILDQLKSILLTIFLGGGIVYALLNLYLHMGNRFILYAWLMMVSITLLINLLYTKLFVRLFNKLTPLPPGELFDNINNLAVSTGYEVKKISVMDASKRSSKLNAYFSGFGKFKQIVLFDTLIEKCSPDEIVSVLAHEIGHAKHKDVLRQFFISTVQMSVVLVLLTFFLSSDELSQSFGFQAVHMGFALILFGILLEPVGIVAGIPLTYISRKAEYQADAFAAASGYRDAMISALKVLARENFANLTPHPLVVRMTYSHPPISQRIEALNEYYRTTAKGDAILKAAKIKARELVRETEEKHVSS